MKMIVSALVALSVLAGIPDSANAALDAKTFWQHAGTPVLLGILAGQLGNLPVA